MILILDGHGSTTVWNDAGKRVSFEWKAGALFAIPLNAWHQHFNGSGPEAGALRLRDQRPPVLNLYEEEEFVFNSPHDFKNRFNGEPDYFANRGEQKGLLLQTNFVADAINLPLISAKERGAGGGHIRFNMARGSMNSHISQFPVGTYKKGHRHGPGAHVIILSGEGYSLMWPEGEEPRRYDWQVGSMIVPPNLWYHQHFNTGYDAGALSRLQARGGFDPQRAGRAQGLDQPAHRRRPDRLRRRDSRWCARCSPRLWQCTGWNPRWIRYYDAEKADLPEWTRSPGVLTRVHHGVAICAVSSRTTNSSTTNSLRGCSMSPAAMA